MCYVGNLTLTPHCRRPWRSCQTSTEQQWWSAQLIITQNKQYSSLGGTCADDFYCLTQCLCRLVFFCLHTCNSDFLHSLTAAIIDIYFDRDRISVVVVLKEKVHIEIMLSCNITILRIRVKTFFFCIVLPLFPERPTTGAALWFPPWARRWRCWVKTGSYGLSDDRCPWSENIPQGGEDSVWSSCPSAAYSDLGSRRWTHENRERTLTSS